MNVNNKFVVSPDGSFRAKNATIEGYIDAKQGSIAGFDIGKTAIQAIDAETGETRLLITTQNIQSVEELESSLSEIRLSANTANAVIGQTIPAQGDVSYYRKITAYTDNIIIDNPGFLVFQPQFRGSTAQSYLSRPVLDLEFIVDLYKKEGSSYVFLKTIRHYYYNEYVDDFKAYIRYDVAEYIAEAGTYKIEVAARYKFNQKPDYNVTISIYVSASLYYLKQITQGTLIGNNGFLSYWGPQHYLSFDKLTGFEVMRGNYGLRIAENGVQVCQNGSWKYI